jgi:hypothetical protein
MTTNFQLKKGNWVKETDIVVVSEKAGNVISDGMNILSTSRLRL